MNIWEQEIERLTARVKELEEALAYDAMMADQLCTTLERREERIKELEAEISNLDAELDHWSQLAVDDIGKNPPTSWKEIAATAIRERDEMAKETAAALGRSSEACMKAMNDRDAMRVERDDLRKALETVNATAALNRDFNKYMIEPHALEMVEAALRRSASSNREGGE